MEPIRGREQATEALKAFRDVLGPLKMTRYIPWVPHPAQEAFLRLDDLEVFYGGAAGGGKSVALLMAALQHVDQPGYSALLLRRSFPDLRLPGALMDMATTWLGTTDAQWEAGTRKWVFPSGATITFGYLQNENDKYRYRSAEFQYIAFDELTAFTLSQYTFLFSRLRRLQGSEIPLRMRSASNPGGIGHDWVKDRFIDRETREPGSFFLPATLDENPNLDHDAYVAALDMLLPAERERLLHGDWDASERGLIDRTWFSVVDSATPSPVRVRSWDLAASEPTHTRPDPDATVGTLYQRDPDGGYTVVDVVRGQWNPATVEQVVKQTADLDGTGTMIHLEIEPGSAGKLVYDRFARHLLRGYPVSGKHSTGDKWNRARPAIAAAGNGLVRVVRAKWTRDWLDRIGRMAPGNGVHDDELDSWASAHRVVAQLPTRPAVVESAADIRIPTRGEW